MAFKTFAPGVLTSSDVNTFLMRQAVITCTSSTRPASPSEGMTIYETDTDSYLVYSGTAWVQFGRFISFTPTITEFTLGNGTVTAGYFQWGKLVYYRGTITAGSTSAFPTAGGESILVDYPVTPIAGSNAFRVPMLSKTLSNDDSLNMWLLGDAQLEAGGILLRWPRVDGGQPIMSGFNTTDGVPFTLAADDRFDWSVLYEAA